MDVLNACVPLPGRASTPAHSTTGKMKTKMHFFKVDGLMPTLRLFPGLACPERQPPPLVEQHGESRALAIAVPADPQFAADLSCERLNNLDPKSFAGAGIERIR